MTQQELLSQKASIKRIAQSHGATTVKLFGSVVKNTFNENSDVDVLVAMAPQSTLFDIISIKQDLEEFLGKHVDVVSETGISPYLKDQILAEAVIL